jgi:DNA-directed RNA polymerase subunit K/omega
MDSRALYSNEAAREKVNNIFDIVLIASCRYRELKRGYIPMVSVKGGPVQTVLEEIERGIVGQDYVVKNVENNRKQRYENFKRDQRRNGNN